MSALTSYVTQTKADVLQLGTAVYTSGVVTTAATGISGTIQYVQDGAGTATALGLSTAGVTVNGVFKIGTSTLALTSGNSLTLTTTGSTNVTLPTSGTLLSSTVTTLNSLTTATSLVSIGTITNGTWNGTVLTGTYGGTGVNNGSSTITVGGNVAFSGAYTFTGTLTGNTAITFPTSGTLLTSAVTSLGSLTSAATLDTVGTITTGTWNATTIAIAKGGTGVTSITSAAVSGLQASQTLVQRKHTTIASTNGTSTIPLDNTIPQNTEGSQISTLSITPLSATNRLVIHAHIPFSNTSSTYNVLALFQDSTANALACQDMVVPTANYHSFIDLYYEMAAGTTSSTTFNLRLGASSGTWYLTDNGVANFGGVLINNAIFEIYEYTP